MKNTSTCILYDNPQAAEHACDQLRQSSLASPTTVTLHEGDIPQDQFTVAQSRSRTWALFGALSVGLAAAVFVGFASSATLLDPLRTTTAFWLGLAFGAALGALTGMLAGATEPPRALARAREAVRAGNVALVARFRDPEQARHGRSFLATRPGAVGSIA